MEDGGPCNERIWGVFALGNMLDMAFKLNWNCPTAALAPAAALAASMLLSPICSISFVHNSSSSKLREKLDGGLKVSKGQKNLLTSLKKLKGKQTFMQSPVRTPAILLSDVDEQIQKA